MEFRCVLCRSKLHYRKEEDATGFVHQQLPTHIMYGIGQVFGSVRDPLPESIGKMPLFDHIRAGESNYNRYDRSVTELAVKWLRDHENANADSPCVLFVGLVAPNFPLIVPPSYLDLTSEERRAGKECVIRGSFRC